VFVCDNKTVLTVCLAMVASNVCRRKSQSPSRFPRKKRTGCVWVRVRVRVHALVYFCINVSSRNNVVYWKETKMINNDLQCNESFTKRIFYWGVRVATYHRASSLQQKCNTLQFPTTHCKTLQHTATHCNTLQRAQSRGQCYTPCTFLRCSSTHTLTATNCNKFQYTATHCNVLQYTATRCNTLQHTATHCNTLQHTATL